MTNLADSVSAPSVALGAGRGPGIGVGILGVGQRGVRFAGKSFDLHPDSRLVGLCDIDTVRLQAARAELGDVPATTSLDEFLALPGLDAVVICTADRLHATHALAALNAGKHVFLEKPMAQSIEDCDRISSAALRSDLVFMVGLELRYCSVMEDLKALIDSDRIGSIKLGSVVDNVSVGGDFYFHGARRRKEVVGSLILEKGTHSLDLTNWLLDASPRRVFCTAGLSVFGGTAPADKHCSDCAIAGTCPYFVDRERGLQMDYGGAMVTDDLCVYSEAVDVDDNAIVVIDYDNGARVSYSECHFAPDYSREFSFTGTKGRVTAFYNNEQDYVITVVERHSGATTVFHPERRPGGHGGSDEAVVQAFIDLIHAGKPATPGLRGARDAAAIAIAAMTSSRTGQPAQVPVAPWAAHPNAAR